ncbi:hypothetical protein KUL118_39050 [Tenacibaculum sp. KUL118]|nr:hypothetical protein KUL118_39050 [Tenacibaculum sp. KUL118]
MTTTIYDRFNRLVLTDTRWSAPVNIGGTIYLVFVDDCDFEKIANRDNAVMILAGDGQLIARWKQWWFESLDPDDLPETEVNGQNGISLIVIDKVNNEVIHDCGLKIAYKCVETSDLKAAFTGSGGKAAAESWIVTQCSRTALTAAAEQDPFTSNIHKYVDFNSGKTNVKDPVYDYTCITDSIIHGGYIMTLNDKEILKLSESPLAETIKLAFASGDLAASAPSPSVTDTEWTPEKKDSLRAAIRKVRKLEGLDQ